MKKILMITALAVTAFVATLGAFGVAEDVAGSIARSVSPSYLVVPSDLEEAHR